MNEAVVCPYCRMPFDGASPAKIFCTACGVPHHEDCYMENGGCTVFGCLRAPADDPKLQVSYSDLNAAAARTQPVAAFQPGTPPAAPVQAPPSSYAGPLGLSQAMATPAMVNPEAPGGTQPQPSPESGYADLFADVSGVSTEGNLATQPLPSPERAYDLARTPKSRTTFIFLGVFLGMLGAHNFYAGYTGRAVGQLCLSVLTAGWLAVVSWVWAIVEICIVEKDGVGIEFS